MILQGKAGRFTEVNNHKVQYGGMFLWQIRATIKASQSHSGKAEGPSEWICETNDWWLTKDLPPEFWVILYGERDDEIDQVIARAAPVKTVEGCEMEILLDTRLALPIYDLDYNQNVIHDDLNIA